MNRKPCLGLDDVKRMAAKAEAEAAGNGWAVTIAVVDDRGHLLWLQQLDGATPLSAHFAAAKARASPLGRRQSRWFEEAIDQGRESFLSAPVIEGLIEGGVPILVDGHCVGALAARGVKSSQDAQIARAGMLALG